MENWVLLYEMGKQRQADLINESEAIRLANMLKKQHPRKIRKTFKKGLNRIGLHLELFGHRLQRMGQTCC